MTQIAHCVGIDVSKDRLDICVLPEGRHFHVANSAAGIGALLARTYGPGVVYGCEATGGHERRLIVALSEAGPGCYCLHPSDVRAFARASGRRAKTDRLDAAAIGQVLGLAAQGRSPLRRSANESQLNELAIVRRRLTTLQSTFKSLKASLSTDPALAIMQDLIDTLSAQLKSLKAQIAATIKADDRLTETAQRITSVPGAGPVLATEIIASMPELGTLSSRQAASLAGVAPHPRQSGRRHMNGRCHGGRPHIRRILYMAALSAIKAKKAPFLQTYQRLRHAGKPFKVAIVAVMRKLIITINAILKNNTPWTLQKQT